MMSFKAIRNLGIFLMTLLIVTIGVLSFVSTGKIINELSRVIIKERPMLDKVECIRGCFVDASDIFFAFTRGEEESIAKAVAVMNMAIEESTKLKDLVGEDRKDVVVNFTTLAKRLRVAMVTYEEETQIDVTGSRAIEMEKIILATIKEAGKALARMTSDVRAKIRAADINMLIAASESQKIIWAGVLIGIFTGFLVAFFIGRALNRPIRQLADATNRIAKGDLSYRVEVKSRDEIGRLANSFNKMAEDLRISAERERARAAELAQEITEREKAEKELERNYETQNVVNKLLGHSLKDININKFLEYALDSVLSLTWFKFEPKGAIFLVENNPGVLVMKVQKGIDELLQKQCAFMPFGRCICGMAALTKKIQFVERLDERHVVTYKGISPHGHYCVPIIFAEKVLGVMNMYVKENSGRSQRAEEFLTAVADTLASVIVRRNAETELLRAYDRLRDTQAQLVQASKMSAVGQLAGGVAHEINNPLTGVLSNVQLIMLEAEARKENFKLGDFQALLRVVEESAIRCKKITQALLDFSHTPNKVFSPVSANNIVTQTVSLIEHEMRLQNITIEKELQDGLSPIMSDPQLLQQVIFDLISNARWAIRKKSTGERGMITLRTQYEAEKARVLISVSDNGIGIPKENLGKIFEPFFTTKDIGEGTGLGLSIVYGIIKEHNGTIEVESQVGQGTTFKIYLPAHVS